VLLWPDLEADVLCDDARQPLELLGEDRRRSVGRLGVVGVAAARVGIRVRSSSAKSCPNPIVDVPAPSSPRSSSAMILGCAGGR
jgi:hypothetical protein